MTLEQHAREIAHAILTHDTTYHNYANAETAYEQERVLQYVTAAVLVRLKALLADYQIKFE